MLRAASYRWSGQTFHRRFGDNWGIVSFQKSRWNDSSQVRFVVNLGTASGAVLDYVGHGKDNPPSEWECHWRRRISREGFSTETWWEIQAGANPREIAALGVDVRDRIASDLPIIESMASDDALLDAHLRSGGFGQTDMDVAGVLIDRLGGTTEQRAAFDAMFQRAIEWRRQYARSPEQKPTRAGVRANIGKLERPQPQVRWEAAWRLAFADPDPEVLAALRAHLGDPDPRARSGIAAALAKLGDRQSLDAIIDLLRVEPGRYSATTIADGLGVFALRDAEARKVIEPALRDRLSSALGFDRVELQAILDRLDSRRSRV